MWLDHFDPKNVIIFICLRHVKIYLFYAVKINDNLKSKKNMLNDHIAAIKQVFEFLNNVLEYSSFFAIEITKKLPTFQYSLIKSEGS